VVSIICLRDEKQVYGKKADFIGRNFLVFLMTHTFLWNTWLANKKGLVIVWKIAMAFLNPSKIKRM